MDKDLAFRRPPIKTQNSKLSFISKLFFCLDIIQVLVVGSIQITMMLIGDYRPVKDGGTGPGRRIYLILFTCCVIYTCILCLFAIRLQNFLEIVAFVFQNYLFMCYSFIQVYLLYFKKKYTVPVRIKPNRTIHILVVLNSLYLVIMNIVFTFLAVRLFREYGWKIYKKVRFNVNLRGAYHIYELVLCLMKMNLLILSMFVICYNQTVLRTVQTSALYIITVAAIPASVVVGCAGYFGIRKENKLLTLLFVFSIVFAIGCYTYTIAQVAKLACFGCMDYFKTLVDLPREVVVHIMYLATLALVFSLALLIATLKAVCNFGKGLKSHFLSRNSSKVTLAMGISRNFSIFKSYTPTDTNTLTDVDAISTTNINNESDSSNTTEHFDQSSTSSTKEILSPSSLDNNGFPLLNLHQSTTSSDLNESVFEADLSKASEENVFENAFENALMNHINDEADLQIVDDSSNNHVSSVKSNDIADSNSNSSLDFNSNLSSNINSNSSAISNSNSNSYLDCNSNSTSNLNTNSSSNPISNSNSNLNSNSNQIEPDTNSPDEQIRVENSRTGNARWLHATKVYDKTLRKINMFYTSTRRQVTLRRRLRKSTITRYGQCSLPSFSADIILSNNGLGIDKSRDRKLGIPPLGVNLFHIVGTEGITNMVSPNEIHSKLRNRRKGGRTQKPRQVSYKFSVSELFSDDNIICEEDEEENEKSDDFSPNDNDSKTSNNSVLTLSSDEEDLNEANISVSSITEENLKHSYENQMFERNDEDDGEDLPSIQIDFV